MKKGCPKKCGPNHRPAREHGDGDDHHDGGDDGSFFLMVFVGLPTIC